MSPELKPHVSATTPPDSFRSTQLTPPLINESEAATSIPQILYAVHNLQSGQSSLPCGWHEYPLKANEYVELLAKVEKQTDSFKGFWKDKLRYDYFASRSIFVLRMPSAIHERFLTSIVQEVIRQLQLIASGNSPASEFAKQIISCGSTTCKFPNMKYRRHDPDGSFSHERAQYPGVIFEVSYSQKSRHVKYLAEDYIYGSNGNIKAVVGLDIEYQNKSRETSGKSAAFSVWKPLVIEKEKKLLIRQESKDVQFRCLDGTAVSSETVGLSLDLADFAPSNLYTGTMNERIFIAATTLAKFLENAEDYNTMIMQDKGEQMMLEGYTIQEREHTPDKEIVEAHEKAIQDYESMVDERAMAEDKSWSPKEQN